MPYLKVDDTSYYYEDAYTGGDGTAVGSLLFLHGWGTSGQVWNAQVPAFADDHRVVTVDWRGCGRSDRPLGGNTLDTVVTDLVGLIGALGLERPVVVGSSMGGMFATELGLRYPALVGGVVSVDGPAYWAAQAVPIDDLLEDLRRDRTGTVVGWVPEWFAPGADPALSDETVRQVLDAAVSIDELIAGLAGYDPRPSLPGLGVPVHYLHGELDSQIPPEVARTCAALTPGAGVTVIPGAGHMPHQESPRAFNAALRDALAGMRGATRTAAVA
ncbi:alpha/beta fold hydrolase [Streptomyces triculaminicus]|uniref:Alpha/beta fold hydrolase n=2 Tax=Streptomyces TaxID=1883 RepID=A0A939FM78_9ACTN|nr:MULTISPECIES: alpha/beta fold hydrolase [Streptomyces]MBO0654128.1 alpha/beta fold hydrolase [Streptomyces triculaminicus]QSY48807.1 alpha/beta fold hydrolase [Streptomyces griseocarneus]